MSSSKHNIIEVNGKRYDARTGRLLSAIDSKPTITKLSAKKATPGVVMDGFSRKPAPRSIRTPTPPSTSHYVHKNTERSKTLMRKGLQKPINKNIHATTTAVTPVVNHKISTSSAPLRPISPQRALRAQHVEKSSLVTKFGQEFNKIHPQTAVLPVKAAPGEALPTKPHAPLAEPSLFQRALEDATSHQQTKHKKPPVHHRVAKRLNVSTRVVNTGAALLAVMLISGFFAYQNVPNLALRVASARAGVKATMPGYHPSGYSVKGAIQYSPGQIVISYGSHSDEREFKLTQRKTEWTDESLVSGFVATDRRAYQTYQDNDKTIYMYDGSNATWIDNGIWYQIEGKQALSSDQILRIAASL